MNKVTTTTITLRVPFYNEGNEIEKWILLTQKKYEGFMPLPVGTILEYIIKDFVCVTTGENELSDNQFIVSAGVKPLTSLKRVIFPKGEFSNVREMFKGKGWSNARQYLAKEGE